MILTYLEWSTVFETGGMSFDRMEITRIKPLNVNILYHTQRVFSYSFSEKSGPEWMDEHNDVS